MTAGQSSTEGTDRRALVVAPTPYYVEKGSTLRVHAMVSRLVDEGYAVDVVCYEGGSDPDGSTAFESRQSTADDSDRSTMDDVDGPALTITRAGIDVRANTEAGPSITDVVNDVFVAARALEKAWSNDYDLVQGEDVEGIAIALLAGAFSDADVVYDLHNPLTENLEINDVPFPRFLSRTIEGVLYRRSDRVLSNWHVWTEAIRSTFDVDHVETVYDELPDATRAVDLPTDRYIAYVGNFKRYQGVDILIDAFDSAATETDVDLLLVGEPTEEIRTAVATSSVSGRIHLVGRHDVAEANAIIANAVATVVPRREGVQPSTKLIHYAMYDPPIIATDLACNGELERFDNEVLWAEPTAESIAARIREVCRDG